ncbi:hypothetical protein SAMN05216365_12118 [Porphyromonadaceae bacterium NLAE-zl-C104]|nr:hypothetical protein SAMN05216365_12118 [Porphyromonadaceae bacterium NLAE-zl-C104]
MQVFLYVFEKIRSFFLPHLLPANGVYSNRQLNSRSAACSSFKYKKEKSYFKKTTNVCLKSETPFEALLAYFINCLTVREIAARSVVILTVWIWNRNLSFLKP